MIIHYDAEVQQIEKDRTNLHNQSASILQLKSFHVNFIAKSEFPRTNFIQIKLSKKLNL